MQKVECGLDACKHNVNKVCTKEEIRLKWQAAINFPQGTKVYVECQGFEFSTPERYDG